MVMFHSYVREIYVFHQPGKFGHKYWDSSPNPFTIMRSWYSQAVSITGWLPLLLWLMKQKQKGVEDSWLSCSSCKENIVAWKYDQILYQFHVYVYVYIYMYILSYIYVCIYVWIYIYISYVCIYIMMCINSDLYLSVCLPTSSHNHCIYIYNLVT